MTARRADVSIRSTWKNDRTSSSREGPCGGAVPAHGIADPGIGHRQPGAGLGQEGKGVVGGEGAADVDHEVGLSALAGGGGLGRRRGRVPLGVTLPPGRCLPRFPIGP
jgi:hypothetical protein